MTADIMGLLNINLVNKFTKDERKWTVLSKTVHFLYVNLLNNRYDKLYNSDKNMYYTQKNRRITNYIVDKSYYFK